MTEQECWNAAYEALTEWENEVSDHNNKILSEYNVNVEDFKDLLDFCVVDDKIEVVEKPEGEEQDEEVYGNLTVTHVDQWSTGMEGDSYSGFIYAKIQGFEKWLKISYSC